MLPAAVGRTEPILSDAANCLDGSDGHQADVVSSIDDPKPNHDKIVASPCTAPPTCLGLPPLQFAKKIFDVFGYTFAVFNAVVHRQA